MEKTAIIVQARIGSTRLPKKLIKPFVGDKTIFEIIVERLRDNCNLPIIIATTLNRNDDVLEEKSKQLGVCCFRGDEKDVLKRFIDAAEANNCEKIIRVCSDNPFLISDSINELIKFVSIDNCDYASYLINDKPSIKTHFGFWAEFVTLKTLKIVSSKTDDLLYHEHVTNFIYEHPDQFLIKWIFTPSIINLRSDIRLTIDTESDFNTAKLIFEEIYIHNNNPKIEDIINVIDKNPDTLENMKKQILFNSK